MDLLLSGQREHLSRLYSHRIQKGSKLVMSRSSGDSRRPVVGIMGASEPSAQHREAARQLGILVAERGWIVLTGGRAAGIMAAACAGAKQIPHSLTLGILPGVQGDVGPDVDLAVFTGMGDARNLINVLSSDVVVACGVESAGTASEVSLALVAGKSVILLGADETSAFFRGLRSPGRLYLAATPAEVVDLMEKELQIPRVTWD
jgi:uncharacterized protein (TIGR00725 family)